MPTGVEYYRKIQRYLNELDSASKGQHYWKFADRKWPETPPVPGKSTADNISGVAGTDRKIIPKDIFYDIDLIENNKLQGQPLSVEEMMGTFPDAVNLLSQLRLKPEKRAELKAKVNEVMGRRLEIYLEIAEKLAKFEAETKRLIGEDEALRKELEIIERKLEFDDLLRRPVNQPPT